MPRVTVCMAVYNGAQTVEKALDSVLAQTYTDFDVLVLDDGSTDGSGEIARRAGLQVITVPNAGVGAGRKRLVLECKSELVAFIDSDDFWLPEKLEKQITLLDETAADMVHADCWYLYGDGRIVPRDLHLQKDAPAFDHILPNNKVIASSAVFRRKAMLDAGNFVADTIRCSDWYGWLIMAPTSRFVHLPEKLVEYSVLDASLANAGYRFYQAQHHLLTKHVLPRRDQLFANISRADKARYTHMIVRDIGLALSGMARAKHLGGSPKDARVLAVDAIRHAPDSVKVWGRALSCLVP